MSPVAGGSESQRPVPLHRRPARSGSEASPLLVTGPPLNSGLRPVLELRQRAALPVLRQMARAVRNDPALTITQALLDACGGELVADYVREALRRGGLPIGVAGLIDWDDGEYTKTDHRDRCLALQKAREWCGELRRRTGGWVVREVH